VYILTGDGEGQISTSSIAPRIQSRYQTPANTYSPRPAVHDLHGLASNLSDNEVSTNIFCSGLPITEVVTKILKVPFKRDFQDFRREVEKKVGRWTIFRSDQGQRVKKLIEPWKDILKKIHKENLDVGVTPGTLIEIHSKFFYRGRRGAENRRLCGINLDSPFAHTPPNSSVSPHACEWKKEANGITLLNCKKPCVPAGFLREGFWCDLVTDPSSPDVCKYVCSMVAEPVSKTSSARPSTFEDILLNIVVQKLPLPASLNQELKKAVEGFKKYLTQGQFSNIIPQKRKQYIFCILNKLLEPNVDDRMILWGTICSNGLPGQNPNLYYDTTGCLKKIESDLYKYIKTKQDIDKTLRFISYWKVSVLYYYSLSREEDALKNLDAEYLKFIQTTGQLNAMSERLQSTMPRYYVAIKDWISELQRDPNSVYSCY
jgi:hypothetical protein